MGIRVLFIYPNTFGMNMLPPAIALFSAILKQHDHQVALFDATYYSVDYGENGLEDEGDGGDVDEVVDPLAPLDNPVLSHVGPPLASAPSVSLNEPVQLVH